MKSEWRLEKSSTEPERFKQLNGKTYLQRRNVKKSEDGYECESRKISLENYKKIKEEENSVLVELFNINKENVDDVNAAILLSQAEIKQTQQAHDEVLAEILLNQAQAGGNENV